MGTGWSMQPNYQQETASLLQQLLTAAFSLHVVIVCAFIICPALCKISKLCYSQGHGERGTLNKQGKVSAITSYPDSLICGFLLLAINSAQQCKFLSQEVREKLWGFVEPPCMFPLSVWSTLKFKIVTQKFIHPSMSQHAKMTSCIHTFMYSGG